MRPTISIRANDVLALFDRLGDAFKADRAAPAEKLADGRAKLGVDAELQRQGASLPPAPARANGGGDPARANSPNPAGTPGTAQPQRDPAKPQNAVEPKAAPEARGPELARPNPERARGEALPAFGFAAADRAHAGNRAEEANVARFLQDPGVPTPAKETRTERRRASDDAGSAFVAIGDRGKRKLEERKLDARREDAKEHPAVDVKSGEKRETKDAREVERAVAQEEVAGDLGEAHGAAWHLESSTLEDERRSESALRLEETMGEMLRCRGVQEDGSRCLRKPVLGIPYCREHAAKAQVLSEDASSTSQVLSAELDATPLDQIADAVGATLGLDDPTWDDAAIPHNAIPSERDFDPLEGPPTDPQMPVFVVTE